MSAQVIPINRWVFSIYCSVCNEPRSRSLSCVNCCYDPTLTSRVWLLQPTSGKVEQFIGEKSPYYGTWLGGRTGAVETLDACKRMVEEACAKLSGAE